MLSDDYINYVATIRRYSPRTLEIYRGVLDSFIGYCCEDAPSDEGILGILTPTHVRNYEILLMDERKESPVTVNLHLSVISGFCRFLMRKDLLEFNPVRLVPRPKTDKKLPDVYREETITGYLRASAWYADAPVSADKESYRLRLARLIVSLLYNTGMRRAELIGLTGTSVDMHRHVIRVHGKGDKIREIPILPALCEEIGKYVEAAQMVTGRSPDAGGALLVTDRGRPLYPMYVDRVVKSQLGMIPEIRGRKSPHVLRHTIATELLDNGTDLNSIKEMLGHSSLSATQVYTHNSMEKLRREYAQAHPRAKAKDAP